MPILNSRTSIHRKNRIILSILCLFISGCSINFPKSGIAYNESWSYNESFHWHDSLVESFPIKDKEEHFFSEWQVDEEATEYETGLMHKTCTICGYQVEQTIEKLEHIHKIGQIKIENIIESTCTGEGSYDFVTFCSECLEETKREIVITEPLGHDLIRHDGKEPTCTENGYEAYYTCSRCDYSTFKTIPAINHKYTTNRINIFNEPTCTTGGLFELTEGCIYNDLIISTDAYYIGSLIHNYEITGAVPATTEDVGMIIYSCSSCGDTYSVKMDPRIVDITEDNHRVVLLDKNMTSEDEDFIGEQIYDSYGLVVNEDNNTIELNKYYAIEERKINYICHFSYDCVASFITIQENGDINSNLYIDIASKIIQFSDYSIPKTICPLLNGEDEFMVSISKQYVNYVIEIRNLDNGAYWRHVFTRNGTGGAGEGSIGYPISVPSQYDYYGFKTSLGTMTISRIAITAPKCDIIFYGDSISELEAYYPLDQFPYSWIELFKRISGNRVLSSGRGGTVLSQIMLRIQNELPFVDPKYCVITIGTNKTWEVEEMRALIQYVKSLGIIPILNHIPCYDNNGDVTGFIEVNDRVDQVRELEGINGCDFDKATSLNNDGKELDRGAMWLENYGWGNYWHHPNINGSKRMVARMFLDAPELFDNYVLV